MHHGERAVWINRARNHAALCGVLFHLARSVGIFNSHVKLPLGKYEGVVNVVGPIADEIENIISVEHPVLVVNLSVFLPSRLVYQQLASSAGKDCD